MAFVAVEASGAFKTQSLVFIAYDVVRAMLRVRSFVRSTAKLMRARARLDAPLVSVVAPCRWLTKDVA